MLRTNGSFVRKYFHELLLKVLKISKVRNLSHHLVRYLRLGALLIVASFPVQLLATHLVGGGLTYRYIRETENTVTYDLTLFVYRDCRPGTEPFDNPAFISIYDGLGQLRYALVNLRFAGEVVLDRPLNGTSVPGSTDR